MNIPQGVGINFHKLTGELAAEIGYWDQQPAIILKAKHPRAGNKDKRYIIRLNDVWIYSEDHYEQLSKRMPPTYESFMLHKCLDLYELFDLGTPSSRQLAEVAWLIQDSIDQMMKLPPYEKRKKVVGEAEATIDGHKFATEVTDDGVQ